MAKDRHSRGENVRAKSHRNPNLLSHYHELSTRVFNSGGRANEYLHNLFLKAAKNGEEERTRNFLTRSSKNSNVNLNYKDKSTGNTAVVLAASRNHVNIVKMLLNYGADITLLNYNGQSIFDVAPQSIIPMLLASVERQGTSNRHLLQAAWQGNLQILRRLLSSKADLDINCKNADGLTPLLLVTRDVNLFEKIEKNAAEKGYNPLEVVKELLQHKADCSMTASDGKSPLHYIAYNKGANAENMANLIIEDTRSRLDLPDQSNSLPIHLASRCDNRPVLLALINGGANVNARGQLGQTPLHVAAEHGHERCSIVLLGSGADVTIVDDHGNSPVDVSENRKVKIVLKEAWVEQTRESSSKIKRSYSAPTELLTQEESRLNENAPDSVMSLRVEQMTSPRKISGERTSSGNLPDVGVNNESQVPHPPMTKPKCARRSHSMTKNPGYMVPRPPGTSQADSVRVKYRSQTRQISSFSTNAGMRKGRQEFELPKLSIKNIELQLTSSFRSDVALQQTCSRYGTIHRLRFLNNPSSSSPLTPNSYQRESISRMSDFSSQGSERVKLPKTLAPLSNEERKSSVNTRQGSSRNSLYSSHDLVGDVLDLDNLQTSSSCHPSLAKIVFHPEDKDIVQPPPSPCEEEGLDLDPPPSLSGDNELEYETNGKETEWEDNDNNVGGNTSNNEGMKDSKDEKLNFEENNENKKKGHDEIENKEEKSFCNNCLINGGCEDSDDSYKTQTFSSTNLSKFWIPCTRNGEIRPGNADVVETSSNDLNNTSQKENNKNNEQEKQDKEKVASAIMDERSREKNRKNSVSFYVDFGDTKSRDSVNQSCKCGKPLHDEKFSKCQECRNRLPGKKTFWISLDGETSDGETDGSSGTKKCVERQRSSSDDGERFPRRAQSLPENKLPFKPKFTGDNCIDLDVKPHEQDLKEKYLIVFPEDTFVIQQKSLEDGVSEDATKDEPESRELKFYSEDTFVIEENVQESTRDSRDSSAKDRLLTENIVDEFNDDSSEHKKSEADDKAVVVEHKELKSSIVLQSLSMDDEQPQDEQNEEAVSPENGANLQFDDLKLKQPIEPGKKVAETLEDEAPLFLGTAWSTNDPTVKQPCGVQICNPFPSPVPPVDVKPEVQPPIGNTLGKIRTRKTNSGKIKKKTSAKESKKKDDKSSIGKEQSSSCGKKGKKGKKGKGKKPKPMFKEISVKQSFVCMSYDEVASNVARERTGGLLSPDLDKVPTLSIDSRSTNKLLRRRFSYLSPIPESPRSAVSVTPRAGEDGDGDNVALEALKRFPVNEELVKQDRASNIKAAVTLEASETPLQNDKLVKQEERKTEVIEEKKALTVDAKDDDGDVGIVDVDGQMGDPDEGVDEVDGGLLSRFFNSCMARLGMASTECDTEPLVGEDAAVNDDKDDDEDIIDKNCQKQQLRFPVDEADQDMEDLIRGIVESYDHDERDVENKNKGHEEELSVDTQSSPEQDTTGSSQETGASSSESTFTSNAHLRLEEQGNEKKTESLKENWTKSYVRQMSGFSPWEFDAPDDVFAENENHVEGSVCMALGEEMLSDDSSYVSCESTSYAVSDCSTTESTDSYFSSKESFHGTTLSSQDETTPGSVDINLYEQIHKPQTSMTGSSSGSNDSRSTIRPRSNSNSSQTSMQSFFSSATRGFVRSQVSSGSGSLSSTTSCGEELQWQKGSILGKGGFGTVYLGLVNTGEMIAVKQVELSNKEESEAEKQYEKLQQEVSLLKSLHHQNIVKYIGTCLDDNSIVNIFMELVPGGSIAQALKRFGAFVEPVFQRYTKQILSGVDYLHKKNVIHRDIKGGNIMLMPNGVIKLIDFGCAKRLCMSLSLSRSSIMHSMKGTPYWMAPEVIKETSGQATKSDIWSIGCTVYEMATGSPPWSPMDPLAAMFAIGNGTAVPQLSNSFSPAARDFTALCMTREPSARPSASELLQHKFILQLI